MLLSELSARQLATFIYAYERNGLVSGGEFTLAQLLQETNRRTPEHPFGTIDTARMIISLSSISPMGIITYRNIWEAFSPGEPWNISISRPAVINALQRVGFYCVSNNFPLIITLVLNDTKADEQDTLSEAIHDYWNKRGFKPSDKPASFLEDQRRLSRGIDLNQLLATSTYLLEQTSR